MNNIDQLLEQIENLNTNDFNKLTKKYINSITHRQKQEFHLKFPNLQLDKYSKIDCIGQSYYYYKFYSQNYTYEFEINKTHKNKYSYKFYVDGNLECSTTKITEKKSIVNGKLDLKTYLEEIGDDINQVDITKNELEEIVNWLYFNKNFIYSLDYNKN